MSRGVTAADALARLRAGNARFAANARGSGSLMSAARRAELAIAQEPFAIVLGCSDSRVPVEIVFDQGPGDLFVLRAAGNIVAPSLIGSVEFAAERFGTRLVVVLGHTQCGAILATIEELRQSRESQSRNLRSIVDRVRPSVEGLLDAGHDPERLVRQAAWRDWCLERAGPSFCTFLFPPSRFTRRPSTCCFPRFWLLPSGSSRACSRRARAPSSRQPGRLPVQPP